MPSGKRHLRLELALLPVILGGTWWWGREFLRWEELAGIGGAYLLSSLLLSPDLDLGSSSARRRWGPLGFIWLPYSKLFKHRGLSHSLLLGPLTRIGYLFLVGWLVALGLRYLGVLGEGGIGLHLNLGLRRELLGMIALGLYLPNALHIVYDRLDSWLRRGRRPRPHPRPHLSSSRSRRRR